MPTTPTACVASAGRGGEPRGRLAPEAPLLAQLGAAHRQGPSGGSARLQTLREPARGRCPHHRRVAIRQILDHLDLSPPEKPPPPDVREVKTARSRPCWRSRLPDGKGRRSPSPFSIESRDRGPRIQRPNGLSASDDQTFEQPSGAPGIGPVPLEKFQPGKYVLQLKVQDKVAKKELTKEAAFEVLPQDL